MIWVFFKNGGIWEGTEDPGDCPKVMCATFREKRQAKEFLANPNWREKNLRKQHQAGRTASG